MTVRNLSPQQMFIDLIFSLKETGTLLFKISKMQTKYFLLVDLKKMERLYIPQKTTV